MFLATYIALEIALFLIIGKKQNKMMRLDWKSGYVRASEIDWLVN